MANSDGLTQKQMIAHIYDEWMNLPKKVAVLESQTKAQKERGDKFEKHCREQHKEVNTCFKGIKKSIDRNRLILVGLIAVVFGGPSVLQWLGFVI